MGRYGRPCRSAFRFSDIEVLRRRGNVNGNAQSARRQGDWEDGQGVVNVDFGLFIFRFREHVAHLRRVGAGLGGGSPADGARSVNESARGFGGRLPYGRGSRGNGGECGHNAPRGYAPLFVHRSVYRHRGCERHAREVYRHGGKNGARWDGERGDFRGDYVFVHCFSARGCSLSVGAAVFPAGLSNLSISG